MLYPSGHRALQTVIDKRSNVLRCRDFHLTINFTENPLLTGFELFSLYMDMFDMVDMFHYRWICFAIGGYFHYLNGHRAMQYVTD